jgi:hypothetical protein
MVEISPADASKEGASSTTIQSEEKKKEWRLADIPLRRMLFFLARQGEGYALARCMCVCKAWNEATNEVS